MKLFQRILCLCVFTVLFVTGEELFLLTVNNKLYWYNTKNKETKKIAEKAEKMACDYERKWLYYTSKKMGQRLTMIVRVRMDPDGGDMKIITQKDKDDRNTVCLGVDQETGNIYYASTKGLMVLSYKQNYTKTIISTRLTGKDVFDVGIHGIGADKRVYWSTLDSLYTSQINNPQLTRFKLTCIMFSIVDYGIVCGDVNQENLFLANLNGVKTESLANMSIQTSKLREIKCNSEDITAFDGRLYIVCLRPNRVLQINIKTKTIKVVVPVSKGDDDWESICPLPDQKVILPDQKVVLPGQSVTILPGTTIVMIVIAVVICIVLIAILTVIILKYKKKSDSMPKRSNSHPFRGTGELQTSSTRGPGIADHDRTEESIYSSTQDNRLEESHLYDTIPFTEHKLSTPEYVEIL